MSGWVLTIVSVVVLTVLLDLFMSEGNTKKYIRGIMSIIIIAVVIAPLPKLVNKNISLAEVFNENVVDKQITADKQYLFRLYTAQFSQKERKIEQILQDNGIENTAVRINIYHFDDKVEIINVLVSLQMAVITVIDRNININDMIVEVVSSVVNVSQELIIIYGKDN